MKKLALSLSLVFLTTSCATWQSSRTQDVKVESQPSGADCRATNELSSGNARTPGTINIERSRKELEITCQLPNYGAGTKRVNPGANWWLLGNIANLGLGYFYDVYTGAAWKYPDVTVPLQPTNGGVFQGNFIMRDFQNPAVMQNQTQFPAGVSPQMQGIGQQYNQQAPQFDEQIGTVPSSFQNQQFQQPINQQQMPAGVLPMPPVPNTMNPNPAGMPPMPMQMNGQPMQPSPMMEAMQFREEFYKEEETQGTSPFNGFFGGKK
jgi:hypothetical protein